MTDADDNSGERTPHPDPTRLTTEQLKREVTSLKELLFARLDATDRTVEIVNKAILARPGETEKMVDHLKGFIESRLTGMDRATELMQAIFDEVPHRVDEKIGALKLLHEEKFGSIQTQFKERDVRTDQSSKDSKVAVDAALQAAKEAVGEQNKSSALAIAKSEAATTKQIDTQSAQLINQTKAVDDKISDVKERLMQIEGRALGRVSNESEHSTSNTFYIAIFSSVLGVISMIITIAVVIKHW